MALRDRLLELREAVEERTGYSLERRERVEILEARSDELGATRRELDNLAWTALDYVGNRPQELRAIERRKLAQKSRIVWMKDPQAGAAVDLMNDFVWGRGLQKPKASDKAVQEVIDEAWDDPDNQLVLTTYQAQLALGTDLSLQSNLFIAVFDDGDDGKVKLGLLEHDAVENVVRDPDNRLRILYFIARYFREEWDFENDMPKVNYQGMGMADAKTGSKGEGEIRYFPHWRNLDDALEDVEKGNRPEFPTCPEYKLGDGKIFHISFNRTTEMAFGHPTADRLIRWYHAYNSFIDARLDIIQAKAAFIMERKVKGTPNQLQKIAQQAVSRRSALGASVQDPDLSPGPRPASIMDTNDSVEMKELSMDTGAASAMQDGQMIRSQVSAATRFPQSYYGDSSNSNLATATSLELPVLKAVESRQEFFESLVRFFIDRVIERAVETGRLPEHLTEDEIQERQENEQDEQDAQQTSGGGAAGMNMMSQMPQPGMFPGQMQQAADDLQYDPMNPMLNGDAQPLDEDDTKRELDYRFSMPNPLQRMLGDVVTAIMNIAQTFDPNNTNPELSRTLLLVALTELEIDDPAGAVDKIFPPGYVDPAVAAASSMGQQAPPQGPYGEFGPQADPGSTGADGDQHPAGNAYGGPQKSQPPGKSYPMMQAAAQTPPQPRMRLTSDKIKDLVEARVRSVSSGFPDLPSTGRVNGHRNGQEPPTRR